MHANQPITSSLHMPAHSQHQGCIMNRILVASLIYIAACAPAFAAYTPLYLGLQIDNITAGALVGYQIDKTYAVEARVTQSESSITHANITSEQTTTSNSVAALAMLPTKLDSGAPYFLFIKAGYSRLTKKETYYIPASLTLTLPYSDSIKSNENNVILGIGAQYDFFKDINGRVGLDITGDVRSVYLGAIFRF
jgi:hypothetical protein